MSKKFLLGIFVLTVVSIMATKSAFAVITGSPHDFRDEGWVGEICVVCHTPHNASGNTLAPLWNHTTTATNPFTIYSSSTLTATDLGQPGSSSKACLSCHDGTVAYDSYGGSNGTRFVDGSKLLGTDISNDHPVSFTYDATLATNDGGLYNPLTQIAFGGKTINQAMLIANKLECSSCHDVHKNKGYSASSSKLLLVNNSGSGLCLTCHNK